MKYKLEGVGELEDRHGVLSASPTPEGWREEVKCLEKVSVLYYEGHRAKA
jgi:hypothetical protein